MPTILNPLTVLSSGRGWIAIDKPHNLSTHNADSSSAQTDAIRQVSTLLKADPALRKSTHYENDYTPSPVHRLDVGTSGVLVFALSPEKSRSLAQEFAEHKTKKVYVAIVKGQISEKTIWNFALTDKAEGRRDPAGTGSKKPCITHVQPLKSNFYFSLIELQIETGRTHQIRRHATLAKHPVIGDTRYGSPTYAKKISEIYGVDRLLLHAQKLTIKIDNMEYEIESPIPREFYKLDSNQWQ